MTVGEMISMLEKFDKNMIVVDRRLYEINFSAYIEENLLMSGYSKPQSVCVLDNK